MNRNLLLAGALVGLLFNTSCSGGGGGGGGGGATADLLIGDAPVDDLLSFSAKVQSVRLQRDDLSFTGDLVGSLEVEFLGLNGALAFLGKGRIPAGTYVAVEIGFVPGSYVAKADDSSPVTIVPATNTYLAALPAPLVVATGEYVRFSVDLDLLSSLSGTVASGSLDFDPSGSCRSNDGSEDEPIDELKGNVLSSSQADGTVLVDAFVGEPPTHIGNVTLLVTGATVLLDNDNLTLSVPAFFGALAAGTLLEAHGSLGANGVVTATRIEIEDAEGGGASVARIRGHVSGLDTGEFSLQITQIKDGASVVQPVLVALGNPSSIQVSYGGSTTFVFDTGGLTTSASLALGQEVTVRFSAFSTSPFPASEVEIDDTPGFHASLGGHERNGELVVHLDARDPAVRAGLVSSAADVRVLLGSAPLTLGVHGAPLLSEDELVPGLELELHGELSGAPAAPVIQAQRVRVVPGYLHRCVIGNVAPAGDNLVVDGGEFVDPFGRDVTPGPLLVWLAQGCTFSAADGSTTTREEFLSQVASGATRVDVLGVGDGTSNEMRAFAVRVQEK